MKRYKIYCDGSCLGNPGRGGWAFVVQSEGLEPQVFGGADGLESTNNRVEMLAALKAFAWVKRHCKAGDRVLLCADSKYMLNAFFEWAPGWAAKGWKTNSGSQIANLELVKAAVEAIAAIKGAGIELRHEWVKGHVGIVGNELVDKFAKKMAQEQPEGIISLAGGQPASTPATTSVSRGMMATAVVGEAPHARDYRGFPVLVMATGDGSWDIVAPHISLRFEEAMLKNITLLPDVKAPGKFGGGQRPRALEA